VPLAAGGLDWMVVGARSRGVRWGRAWRLLALLVLGEGCVARAAAAPPVDVLPAPPPKDDGKDSAVGPGGGTHSAALEQLKVAPLLGVLDRTRAMRVLIPDARHWTRVKFFGIPSLLGLRYGKDHHAVVGVTVQQVPADSPLPACSVALEAWGAPMLDVFDVEVEREPVTTFSWRGELGEIHRSYARTASLAMRDGFAVAYATYPAWKGACLVVGVAVPARDDEPRARAVRDRFVSEVLPRVLVGAKAAPTLLE